ncbi:MAG: permease-like cell division protein FtsX [Clostridia bacterium]|nr:permease-like cell division protein FtsX [Clostridia bacterium]
MKFSYLIGEGFKNVFKNKKSTGASLMIMCATMMIFGLFFLIGQNVNYMLREIESEQGMQVFIKKEATEIEIEKLKQDIQKIEYVSTTKYVSKEEAFNIVKERYSEYGRFLEGYDIDRNPFKASYVVTLTDLSKSEEVRTQIEKLDSVNNIEMRDKTINALVTIANGVRWISFGILVILIFISIFIISNTIKLTVHARRKEISIMKYVGATNSFIRWPFIVEGIIIGVVAAMISILILGVSYNIIIGKIMESSITNMISITLLPFSEIVELVIVVYLGLGIGIGSIGSIISMRKYLEV